MRKKEIEKLAFLARIRLGKEEVEEIPEELESILRYVQKLSDVSTEDVEPLFHFPGLKNEVREDIAQREKEEVRKKMMMMGKDKDDYLKVETIR